jgi:predicted dehydrogenase
MSQKVTRRQFLGTSGKATAGVSAGITLSTMIRDARGAEANEKFNVGIIGCGIMGRGNMRFLMKTEQCKIIGLCDVDPEHLEKAAKQVQDIGGNKAYTTKDHRRILDDKDIDLVVIATPDHWHAIPMMEACAAGKDIYCEKPCCHNIREGRKMLEAAKKYNRIVQVGTLQRSMPHIIEARNFIQAGKLGKICMTNTFNYGNEAPEGLGPYKMTAPPKGVDYERWLGPAPKHAFNDHRWHHSWRWFFEYGAGMIGDWNVHLQDIIMWAMGTPYPKSVSVEGGKYVLTDDRNTPDTMVATYDFGNYVQTYTMRKASGKPWWQGGYGMDFHGSNGLLHLTREGWKVEGDEKQWGGDSHELRVENFEKEGGTDYMPHMHNFLDCVRSRKTPNASIELHYPTVVACHLANVSYKVGRKLFWDHKKELCFNDADLTVEDKEANKQLNREYRKGYELPEV